MFWYNLNRHMKGRHEYSQCPIGVPPQSNKENHPKVYFLLMALSPKLFPAFQVSPSIFPYLKPKLKTKAFFSLQISFFKSPIKLKAPPINILWESRQRVTASKLIKLTQKIALLRHLAVEIARLVVCPSSDFGNIWIHFFFVKYIYNFGSLQILYLKPTSQFFLHAQNKLSLCLMLSSG